MATPLVEREEKWNRLEVENDPDNESAGNVARC